MMHHRAACIHQKMGATWVESSGDGQQKYISIIKAMFSFHKRLNSALRNILSFCYPPNINGPLELVTNIFLADRIHTEGGLLLLWSSFSEA